MFLHGDDCIFTGDSMQLAWAESRLYEQLILERRAIFRSDDGHIEIEADPRHREILLALMNGANVKSVATPAEGARVDSSDAHKA